MFGSPFTRNNSISSPPSQFRDSARNAIYQQLPPLVVTSSSASSIRSAPSQYNNQQHQHSRSHSSLHRSKASSVFSGRRSVRSAPSIYSSSTATIPEDSEPLSITVEQLVNDIDYHETYYKQVQEEADDDDEEMYKICLGSDLQYQNIPESLIDWNLNVTRCKLMLIQLPEISKTPDFQYSQQSLPQLVGDLAQLCQLVLIQPHITDKELIYTLFSSNLYHEHHLDVNFKKSVAEISVKQSRLLQINSPRKRKNSILSPPIISADNQLHLGFKYKEIAIRNYLINLAAAATTAYEYKLKTDALKKTIRLSGDKKKISKDEKKKLWEQVRLDVFRRAGLE